MKNNKTNPSKKPTAELSPSKLKHQINPNIDETNNGTKDPINVSNYKKILSKKQLKKLRKKRAGFFYKVASSFSIFIYSILMTVAIILIVAIFEGPGMAVQAVEKYNKPIDKPDPTVDMELKTIIYDTIRECEEASISGCIDIIEETIVDDIFWGTIDTFLEGGEFIMTVPPDPSIDPPPDPFKGINPMMDEMINGFDWGGNGLETEIGVDSLMSSVNKSIDDVNAEMINWVSDAKAITIENDITIKPDEEWEGGTITAETYTILELINELKEAEKTGTTDLTEADLPKIPSILPNLYEDIVDLATDGIIFDDNNIPSLDDEDFSWTNFIDKTIDELLSILEVQLIPVLDNQISGIVDQVEAINLEVQKLSKFIILYLIPNPGVDPGIKMINEVIADVRLIIEDAIGWAQNATDEMIELEEKYLIDIKPQVDEMIVDLGIQQEEFITNSNIEKIDKIYVLVIDWLLIIEIASWMLLIFSLMGIIVLRWNKKGKLGNRWVALPFTIVFVIPAFITLFGRMKNLDEVFENELLEMKKIKSTK